MKLLISILFLAFVAANPVTEGVVPRCKPMLNFDRKLFPTMDNINSGDLLVRVTEPQTLDELKSLIASIKGPFVVDSSGLLKHDQSSQAIYEPYGLYMIKIVQDYPKVQFLNVNCPSAICEYLGTTTFAALYFYRDGQQKAKLTDGEEMSVYLKTLEEVFGDNQL